MIKEALLMENELLENSNFIMYTTDDGQVEIEVRLEDENVWLIFNRVDSEKENIGLTNFKGNMQTRAETEIAKNYLSKEENGIYISFPYNNQFCFQNCVPVVHKSGNLKWEQDGFRLHMQPYTSHYNKVQPCNQVSGLQNRLQLHLQVQAYSLRAE